MAELCLQNNAVIVSDEIHSELLLGDSRHIPMGSLSHEIAARTVTLIAPSKSFNVPGLFCGFAIIPDAVLRENFEKELERMTLHVSSPGLIAAQAAFSGECDDWLAELRRYLTSNRDFVVNFIEQYIPGIRTTIPEATYLSWFDCSGVSLSDPYKFFLNHAKVALNDGHAFGSGGEGFVRLNYGCPRNTLVEALERINKSIK
jgi:cystathionine beta-lyase